MNATQKSTKRNYLVTIAGIPGTWAQMSGGGVSASVTKDWDGGATRPSLLAGPPEAEDLELTRTVTPARDKEWMDRLEKRVGLDTFTIMKQQTDANGMALGKPKTYPDCLLIGLTDSDVDASSSDAAPCVLKFATTGAA